MNKITLIQPDDWHVHFRDGDILKTVVPETDKNFGKCIVMPNLVPPIINGQMANEYKKRISKFLKNNLNLLMTIYLTENLKKHTLINAYKTKQVFAVKLYPLGATTNSENGIKDVENIIEILSTMEENDIPLLIHGEDTNPEIDIFDREKSFLDKVLTKITQNFPKLRITLEHITTKEAVQFILSSKNVVGSITPHHLASNRNEMLVGGIRPHLYCLPILKRDIHQQELIKIAISGNKKFFLGTDSAPHEIKLKENECGCAGVFNAPYSLQIITQIFDNHNALNKLENFVSINGTKHYKLPNNKKKVSLKKFKNPIKFNDYLGSKIKFKIYKPQFSIFWDYDNK